MTADGTTWLPHLPTPAAIRGRQVVLSQVWWRTLLSSSGAVIWQADRLEERRHVPVSVGIAAQVKG